MQVINITKDDNKLYKHKLFVSQLSFLPTFQRRVAAYNSDSLAHTVYPYSLFPSVSLQVFSTLFTVPLYILFVYITLLNVISLTQQYYVNTVYFQACSYVIFSILMLHPISSLLFSTSSMMHAGPWPPSIQFPDVSNCSCISQACNTHFLQVIFNLDHPTLSWLSNSPLSFWYILFLRLHIPLSTLFSNTLKLYTITNSLINQILQIKYY